MTEECADYDAVRIHVRCDETNEERVGYCHQPHPAAADYQLFFDPPLIVRQPTVYASSTEEFNKKSGGRVIWGQGQIVEVFDWRIAHISPPKN